MPAVPFYCDWALCPGHKDHIQVCSLSSSQTIKENIMGSIADKSINDVKANAETLIEDVKENVEDRVEAVEEKVNALSTAKKVVLYTSAVVVSYSVISGVVRRLLSRNDAVVEGDIVVVTADQVSDF
jgi:hypothetical protein